MIIECEQSVFYCIENVANLNERIVGNSKQIDGGVDSDRQTDRTLLSVCLPVADVCNLINMMMKMIFSIQSTVIANTHNKQCQ